MDAQREPETPAGTPPLPFDGPGLAAGGGPEQPGLVEVQAMLERIEWLRRRQAYHRRRSRQVGRIYVRDRHLAELAAAEAEEREIRERLRRSWT